MSERAKLIEETKKEILSLLISLGATRQNPGIPIKTFNNDYRGLIGSPIPFKELGFATLEDFFHQIPDTVSLVWSDSGPAVKAVENESVSHIVRLVDNQRNKTAVTRSKKAARGGYRGGYRGGGGYRGRGGYVAGSGRLAPGGGGGGWAGGSGGWGGPSVRYTVPPRFHERFHRPQPKPKPTSLMPEEPQPQQRQQQEEKYIPPPERPRPSTGPQPSAPSVPALTRGMIRELLTAYPNGIYGENVDIAFSRRFGQTLNPCKLGFKNMYTMFAALKDIVVLEDMDDDFRIRQVDLRPMLRGQRTPEADSQPISSGPKKPEPVSLHTPEKRSSRDYVDEDVLKMDIREVLSHHLNTGIWASEFSKYFKDKIGVDLPLRQLGYTSVIELMGELSDVVVIKRESAHDWKLYDCKHPPANSKVTSPAGSVKASSVRSDPTSQTRLPELSAGLREAVRQVVSSHSDDGLPFYELPEIFKEMVGKPLPILEIGYPSLDSLVQRLVATNVLRQEVKGQGLILLRAVDRSPSTSHLLNKPGLGQPVRHSVPADAVGPGVKYTLMDPPRADHYVGVFVGHVTTPTHFWLQIKGDMTTLELEYLMDDLEDVYYGVNSAKYLVPESLLAPQMVCVAIFPSDNNWHRVTIERIVNEDFVEVYFVDYGGSCSIHKQNLRLLKTRFLKHPAQALLARLAYIEPTSPSGWSAAATRRMLNLTAGRTLQAFVNSVDQNQVLTVCLCDTNGEEDVHIQDQLVDEGHAKLTFSPDGEIKQQEGSHNPDLGERQQPAQAETIAQEPHKPQVDETTANASGVSGSEKPTSSQEEPTNDNIAYVSPMKRVAGSENVDAEEAEVEEEEDDMEPQPTCVKFVELTEAHSIHIINYEDCPYVLSSEISAFLWDKDLLRSMLRQKRIDVPRKVLPCDEYTSLFEEFLYYGISGVTDRDGKQKSHLTMYSLKHIPEILDVFNHSNPELRAAVEQEIINFYAEDPYWRGEDEMISDLTSDSSSYTYRTTDLQLSLKSLQYRRYHMEMLRKKIVEQMTVKGDAQDTQKLVGEMQDVEASIANVRSLMEDAQKREANTDDEFIQQCISEQYKTTDSKPAQAPKLNPGYFNTPAAQTAPSSNSMPFMPAMNPGLAAGYGVTNPGFGMAGTGFGGVPTSNPGNLMDMSVMMSSLLMSTGGLPNVPVAAGGIPNSAGLSMDQQQFLLYYQMLLGQQAQMQQQTQMQQTQMQMAGNPMMNMAGFGFPGTNLTNLPGGLNPGQMSMADMSVLLLGQGRGVPSHLQSQQGPRPGGLQ